MHFTTWQTRRFLVIWTLASLQQVPLLCFWHSEASWMFPVLLLPCVFLLLFFCVCVKLCLCPPWMPFKIESKFCHAEVPHEFSDFLATAIESLYTSIKALTMLSPNCMWTCWLLSALKTKSWVLLVFAYPHHLEPCSWQNRCSLNIVKFHYQKRKLSNPIFLSSAHAYGTCPTFYFMLVKDE